MGEKDYYIILGVSRTESQGGIKAAFRRLAKKYHPDHSGPEGTRLFQEILEAYTVLSEPEARRVYTAQLIRNEVLDELRRERVKRRVARAASKRRSRLREFIFDELLRDVLSEMEQTSSGGGDHDRLYDIEVVLTRSEAGRGGTLKIPVPMAAYCPLCGGTGHKGFSHCPLCLGNGVIPLDMTARIPIPANIRDGAVLRVPVREAGLILRIFIRVESDEL